MDTGRERAIEDAKKRYNWNEQLDQILNNFKGWSSFITMLDNECKYDEDKIIKQDILSYIKRYVEIIYEEDAMEGNGMHTLWKLDWFQDNQKETTWILGENNVDKARILPYLRVEKRGKDGHWRFFISDDWHRVLAKEFPLKDKFEILVI